MIAIGIALDAVVLGTAATSPDLRIAAALVVGIVGGVALLVRGFSGYRTADRVGGIGPSRIASIAAGEVLVTGAAEPIELTLVSPLQSTPCVYFRSRISDSGKNGGVVFREERAVGFRIRDATGAIRVFPAGARFDVPDRYNEQSGPLDGTPIGLLPRTGSVYGPGTDREAQIAALLTVHASGGSSSALDAVLSGAGAATTTSGAAFRLGAESRRYTEARIEPGDVITIVGRVVPFGDIGDPTAANLLDGGSPGTDDPEIAADLAAAAAAGRLEPTPAAAWGNAAIEGFGIGRPVRPPTLDPDATVLPTGDASLARRAREAFDIPPETLVLASAADGQLLVSAGSPSAVVVRQQDRFLLGLLGAALSIGSAIVLAILVTAPGP